jgi:hypothetical protein
MLALEAAAALATAWLLVRWSPKRRLGAVLRGGPSARRPLRSTLSSEDVLHMVERVAHAHPCRPRCLERALAGRWMLARRGRASTLVIGARRSAFEAHAWLEIDGRTSPPADVSRFDPLWRSS